MPCDVWEPLRSSPPTATELVDALEAPSFLDSVRRSISRSIQNSFAGAFPSKPRHHIPRSEAHSSQERSGVHESCARGGLRDPHTAQRAQYRSPAPASWCVLACAAVRGLNPRLANPLARVAGRVGGAPLAGRKTTADAVVMPQGMRAEVMLLRRTVADDAAPPAGFGSRRQAPACH